MVVSDLCTDPCTLASTVNRIVREHCQDLPRRAETCVRQYTPLPDRYRESIATVVGMLSEVPSAVGIEVTHVIGHYLNCEEYRDVAVEPQSYTSGDGSGEAGGISIFSGNIREYD